MFRLNGYSTAQFGKNHETAAWEISVSGPTSGWPTRSGFDKFYGFMGGKTNQWAPLVYDSTTPIALPHDPNYHFMTGMTNQAVKWVQAQKSLTPERPFFMYFAPGATHALHQESKEWIAKYKGQFDQGWDQLREQTLARQMEVFAAFVDYADTEIGRLVDALRDLEQFDNTLIFSIVGDNGACAEGGATGLLNENAYFNRIDESIADQLQRIDDLGGTLAYNHYAPGWAIAGDAPCTWTKQVASSYGGTRNPLVVHWPARIKGTGEVRPQWHHVIDVAPTVLEAA
jgi:arylsulfatase A-like enzyme